MQNQTSAILSIALFAAFADGKKAETEREQIRKIAESLQGSDAELDLAKLYQDVLLKRVDLATATSAITDSNMRQLAYEMAVCVCDADGVQTQAEQDFLATLQSQLQLSKDEAKQIAQPIDDMIAASALGAATGVPEVLSAQAIPTAQQAANMVNDAELDKSILNYAILNGALELLPQSWASMAIIPLQIKMVYAIGKAHGYQLDKGHITEFLTTAGVGMTSQYLEQFGRKLIGGLLGQLAGSMGKGIGRAATGMAFWFATTYALGHLAKRYYSGGRQMETAVLRDTFQQLLGPAKNLQQQYIPQIQEKSRTLDADSIMNMVRGV
jgi:uncharacterized protein (DUF697 family)/tellurite resistance protein